MNYDAVIVGGGPAGLAAAIELGEAGFGVLLVDKESFGGPIINVEWIDDYPEPGQRVAGAMLASELVERAKAAGVEMELGEVVEVEAYSGCISVACESGSTYTASIVVLAAGLLPRKLGIPGEDEFQGKGVIHCAMCDAGLYRERVVAVCGGGNAALIEAMFLARFADKVHVIEAQPALAATPALQQLAAANPKLAFHYGTRPTAIVGADGVTGLALESVESGGKEELDVYGVLVRIGFLPATGYLESVVELDDAARIVVDEQFATDVPGLFAAGDIRSDSPRHVRGAVADGKRAAASAMQRLRALRSS